MIDGSSAVTNLPEHSTWRRRDWAAKRKSLRTCDMGHTPCIFSGLFLSGAPVVKGVLQ